MLLVEVLFFLLLCLSAGQQGTTVRNGDDATLQCHCPTHVAVTMLEWTRLEQKSDGYVFFYRNKRLIEDYQHPSFRGRVELRDPEMKDGDVSVTLKNVTVNDAGTYKCQITSKSENGKVTEFSSIVSLTVRDSAPLKLTEGNKGEGDKDEGENGGGNKDEGDNGGGYKDGSSQKLVVLAACGTVGGFLLIIGVVVFFSYKMMNKHTYVLPTCCSQDLKGQSALLMNGQLVRLEDSEEGGND